MSRFGIDPPDDDAYDVRYDGTDCADCGRPSVAWLCETCSDQRDAHTSALEQRFPAMHVMQERPAILHTIPVVDVALVPIQTGVNPAIVEVALVPISHLAGPVVECGLIPIVAAHVFDTDARFLKRMAKAILSADLSNVKDVA